ncbi:rCG22601 [Rattus norvegicus]|uniref:RCG22601 n=1 Tax=Rattus norvegicus TaxID=10116 RepID=A6IN81_RAT|nr:rCG22601 [Rattus norvegicus]
MRYLCKLLGSPWHINRLKCRKGGTQAQPVKTHCDGEQLPYRLPIPTRPSSKAGWGRVRGFLYNGGFVLLEEVG